MRRSFNGRIIGAVAALLAAAAALLAAFSLMSRPYESDMSLADSPEVRFGWSYQVSVSGRVRDYEPAFGEDRRIALPEGTGAARLTRTMTEQLPDAELEWYRYLVGVEVSLDGVPLYTDFPGTERGADGFLRLDGEDWARLERETENTRRVRMSLPADYLGRELTVTTYFPEDSAFRAPVYPHVGSRESAVAPYIVKALKDDAALIIYALLTLLMAGLYMLDARNGGGDGRTLLLCLYFLLVFFKSAAASYAGYYSVLRPWVDLGPLYELYMAPLYLYLALRLKRRWKWPLAGCVAAWALYVGVRQFLWARGGLDGTAYIIGPGALLVMLAVTAAFVAETVRGDRKLPRGYALTAAVVTVWYLADRSRGWGGLGSYLEGTCVTLRAGNFDPLVSLVTGVISVMTVIIVVTEAVRRAIRTQRTVDVLRERSRQTMAGYERLLASEDDTRALHHEMRHHMIALSAFLADGDVARARRYVDAVADDLGQVPAGRYCQNILVDMIAGSYLDRAQTAGIRVEHHLNVPRTVDIADEDLSVFLSNMLQNALEACQRMPAGEKRYIWIDMHLRGNFLCVQCVNSAPEGEPESQERPGHGYGLAAMRAVAEKYNSVLLVERTAGEFSVLSDFCLGKI